MRSVGRTKLVGEGEDMKRILVKQRSTIAGGLAFVVALLAGGCATTAVAPVAAGLPRYAKTWTVQVGSPEYDFVNGMAVDGEGSVYLTGATQGSFDGGVDQGKSDVVIAKFGADGAKRWTRQLGTASYDSGQGVAVDATGAVYVAMRSDGPFAGPAAPGAGGYLVKLSGAGEVLSTTRIEAARTSFISDVGVDASGNVLVAGSTYAGLDGHANAGGTDLFLMKFDPGGTRLWTMQQGTKGGDDVRALAIDAAGNTYLTGTTYGDLDGRANAGQNDLFLLKVDPQGRTLWVRQMGSSRLDGGWDVAVGADGGAVVTGNGSFGGSRLGADGDIVVAKFDAAGTPVWTRRVGTGEDDRGEGVALDRGGNVHVAGFTKGALGASGSAGSLDIALLEYDPDGTLLSAAQTGTAMGDRAQHIAVGPSGAIYVAGITGGAFEGNAAAGEVDIFLMKLVETAPPGMPPSSR